MSKIPHTTPWFEYPKFHWNNKHATIIGGGIAGCQMAWHLCQKGWNITLIERHNKLATEASGNPIGVILPKMTSQESLGEDFYTQCFNYTLSQLEILQQHGKAISWKQCGALQLSHNAREEKRWNALVQRHLSTDFVQLLDKNKTSKQAGISLQYKSCYFPQAGWIRPDSFCQSLIDHPNCKVIYHAEALSLSKQNKEWYIQDNENQNITKAEAVIICNGKDLFNFNQSNFFPYQPVTGQTTYATANLQSKNLKTVIGHEGYLTPSINGQHLFGATFDRNQNEPRLTIEADERNGKQLEKYLPSFAKSISQYVSFNSAHAAVRMTTPDRFPYVGAIPDKDFYQKNYHDLHQGKHYKKYHQHDTKKGYLCWEN